MSSRILIAQLASDDQKSRSSASLRGKRSAQRELVGTLNRLARHFGFDILHTIDAAQVLALEAAAIVEIGGNDAEHRIAIAVVAAGMRWPMLPVMAVGVASPWVLRFALG